MCFTKYPGDRAEILLPEPITPAAMEALESHFVVHYLWRQCDKEMFLRERGSDIFGIATSAGCTITDASLMRRLPNLQIIANLGVGYDNVNVIDAARCDVVVTNTPDVLDDEVADLAIGLLIATVRRIPEADRFLRGGKWLERPFPLSSTLRGRRVGVVGLGRIGKAIARRLEGFGVEIAYHGRTRQDGVNYSYHPTLMGLATANDVLIVATPGGAATSCLIDSSVLDALGPDGVLINVARGSVVDERALIDALKSRKILAAGLDVYEDEPHVPHDLIELTNVVLLPHVGSASAYTRTAMVQLMVDNLISWFAGQGPLTPVPETPGPSIRSESNTY